MGHYFGLKHTFEGSSDPTTCPDNTDCFGDGDAVCDTDPHALVSGCPTGNNPCTGNSYLPVNYNIMNYSDCPNRFTAGQRDRMIFQLTNYRSSLASSLASLPIGVYPTNLVAPVAACAPAATTNPNNTYQIGPGLVSFADLAYGSNGYTGDNNQFYIDNTLNTCQKAQSVAHVTAGSIYQLDVMQGAYNQENAKAWIDWNNNGTFEETELVLDVAGSTVGIPASAMVEIPTDAPGCTPLRMRIVSDYYGNINITPCGDLLYGQTEDFIVIVNDSLVPHVIPLQFHWQDHKCRALRWRLLLSGGQRNHFLV